MRNTQLACPHCKSMLTFGTEIAPGTPLTCLICSQPFAATKPIETAPPVEQGAPAMPASPKLSSAPREKPSAPATKGEPLAGDRSSTAAASGNGMMLAATIVFLAMFTAGIAFGVWRMTQTPSDTSNPDNPLAVSDAKNDPSKQRKDAGNGKTNGQTPDDGKIKPPLKDNAKENAKPAKKPALSEEEEEDIRRKLEDEVKQSLKRSKNVGSQGTEPKFDPITTVSPAAKITGLDQKKINAAIDRGIAYLRKNQGPEGTWEAEVKVHEVGLASLCGLTLIECGTPATDPAIQRALAYVRAKLGTCEKTYEIAAAILFLDRAGEPRDRGRIQGAAVRLMAGQRDRGGWSYMCPALDYKEMFQLYYYLESHRPANQPAKGTRGKPFGPPLDLFEHLGDSIEKNIPGKGLVPVRPEKLVPSLQRLPIVVQPDRKALAQAGGAMPGFQEDNSNTQFAILALWTARRHGVPSERALLAAYQHFLITQHIDGGWPYHSEGVIQPTGTMTCAGLLGLWLGHQVSPNLTPALQNPAIQKGLHAAARYIEQPSADPSRTKFEKEDLYLLWSVERVAMIFDLASIGGKDWYGWGAQNLVHNQEPDGSWTHPRSHGATATANTCFALLFLRRSNLAVDVTTSLRISLGIRDSK